MGLVLGTYVTGKCTSLLDLLPFLLTQLLPPLVLWRRARNSGNLMIRTEQPATL